MILEQLTPEGVERTMSSQFEISTRLGKGAIGQVKSHNSGAMPPYNNTKIASKTVPYCAKSAVLWKKSKEFNINVECQLYATISRGMHVGTYKFSFLNLEENVTRQSTQKAEVIMIEKWTI